MCFSKSSSGIWQIFYKNALGKQIKVSVHTKLKSEALMSIKIFHARSTTIKQDNTPLNVAEQWHLIEHNLFCFLKQ